MGGKEAWSVEDVLLTARSITRAQRMDAELRKRGIKEKREGRYVKPEKS